MRHVWILGASGTGKTTLLEALKKTASKRTAFLCLDSIHGEPEHPVHQIDISKDPRGWQKAATRVWADWIAALGANADLVVMDGQSRWAFVREASREAGLAEPGFVLVHCDDEIREQRLIRRGHPELANDGMRGWARWLRTEAEKEGSPVLDTTALPVDEAARSLATLLRL